MQRCPNPDGCIDEASAEMLVMFEELERVCSEMDSKNALRYKESLQRIMEEDLRFIERLRASKVYARVKAEVRAEIEAGLSRKPLSDYQKDDFQNSCKELLNMAKGAAK